MGMQWKQDEHVFFSHVSLPLNEIHGVKKKMGTKPDKENSPYSWKSTEEEQETQPAVVRESFPEKWFLN